MGIKPNPYDGDTIELEPETSPKPQRPSGTGGRRRPVKHENRPSVLLVAVDVSVRRTVRQALDEEFDTTAAASANEAFACLQREVLYEGLVVDAKAEDPIKFVGRLAAVSVGLLGRVILLSDHSDLDPKVADSFVHYVPGSIEPASLVKVVWEVLLAARRREADAPRTRPELGTPETDLVNELRLRLIRLHTDDHFQRLGLVRNATDQQVRDAFLRLAKRFHPDRFSAAMQASMVLLARALLPALMESFAVVMDPSSRARYVAQLEASRGGQGSGGSRPPTR